SCACRVRQQDYQRPSRGEVTLDVAGRELAPASDRAGIGNKTLGEPIEGIALTSANTFSAGIASCTASQPP
ncbi:hypothetical protein, partial [Frankia sp. CIT1]|uniref:hypothetical protein n=1 Tax=Frankia sp. CIT1 TaxID=2880974 RepID=UPI001EF5CEAB